MLHNKCPIYGIDRLKNAKSDGNYEVDYFSSFLEEIYRLDVHFSTEHYTKERGIVKLVIDYGTEIPYWQSTLRIKCCIIQIFYSELQIL